MSELLQVGIVLAVIIIVVGIILHSKLSAVHAAALAPVSIALVPVSSGPAATLPTPVIADTSVAKPAAPVAPSPSTTDLLFPGANQAGPDSRAQPSQEIPPDYFVMDGMMRNGRTALVYGADNGVLFGAKPGKTSYTIMIPPGAQQAQSLQFNKDGVKTGHENCTVSVNGGVPQDVYQTGSPTIILRFPGAYTLDVECDALFTITPNYTT